MTTAMSSLARSTRRTGPRCSGPTSPPSRWTRHARSWSSAASLSTPTGSRPTPRASRTSCRPARRAFPSEHHSLLKVPCHGATARHTSRLLGAGTTPPCRSPPRELVTWLALASNTGTAPLALPRQGLQIRPAHRRHDLQGLCDFLVEGGRDDPQGRDHREQVSTIRHHERREPLSST